MDVHHDVVARNLGAFRREVSDAHIRRQMVDLTDVAGDRQAGFGAAQIDERELVRRRGLVRRTLDVGAPHPVAAGYQVFDQVVADETARAGDEQPLRHPRLLKHGPSLRQRRTLLWILGLPPPQEWRGRGGQAVSSRYPEQPRCPHPRIGLG
jgi:hypothetical protein